MLLGLFDVRGHLRSDQWYFLWIAGGNRMAQEVPQKESNRQTDGHDNEDRLESLFGMFDQRLDGIAQPEAEEEEAAIADDGAESIGEEEARQRQTH